MRKNLNKSSQTVLKRRQAEPELKLRRILVPLDLSGLSRQALTCAVPLARSYKAKISLVHVVQPPIVVKAFPDGVSHIPISSNDLMNSIRVELDDLAKQLLPGDLLDRTIVRAGNAAYEVVLAANRLNTDLIVLSTNGRSGLKRAVLGSTAERIVRHAKCPVLTVRRRPSRQAVQASFHKGSAYARRLPWRRILVPLDFSLTSLRALPVAVQLAKQCGARLLLLNVVEPSPYPTGMEGVTLIVPDSELAQYAGTELPRIARRFVPKSVRVTPLIDHGRAANAIVDTAEEQGVDLIVLSTHGHTGLDRLLLGSTAEHVVRHAKCPVLVVRKHRD